MTKSQSRLIATTLLAVVLALAMSWTSAMQCRADESSKVAPPREDQLADRLDLPLFEELRVGLLRQAWADPAAVHAYARALVARDRKAARRWAGRALTEYLGAREGRKDTALRALVVELRAATADDRDLLRKCVADADRDVADLACVALAAVKDPADLEFFLDALEHVPPTSKWSAAVGVLTLGDGTTLDRFKKIIRSPGWGDDRDAAAPVNDVVVWAARRRLANDLARRYLARRDAESPAPEVKPARIESREWVHWILEMKLEGELGKQDLDRERKLVAQAWSKDRSAVVAAISLALTPQASTGNYDGVRAGNAIGLLESGASADDLDQILRRFCGDPLAPDDLHWLALDALASHGVAGSKENHRLLVTAILNEPHSLAATIAFAVVARGDGPTAAELRSEIGHRGADARGLSDEELGHVALALTSLSRGR